MNGREVIESAKHRTAEALRDLGSMVIGRVLYGSQPPMGQPEPVWHGRLEDGAIISDTGRVLMEAENKEDR